MKVEGVSGEDVEALERLLGTLTLMPTFPVPTYQGGNGKTLKSVENRPKSGSSGPKIGPSFGVIPFGDSTGVTPGLAA